MRYVVTICLFFSQLTNFAIAQKPEDSGAAEVLKGMVAEYLQRLDSTGVSVDWVAEAEGQGVARCQLRSSDHETVDDDGKSLVKGTFDFSVHAFYVNMMVRRQKVEVWRDFARLNEGVFGLRPTYENGALHSHILQYHQLSGSLMGSAFTMYEGFWPLMLLEEMRYSILTRGVEIVSEKDYQSDAEVSRLVFKKNKVVMKGTEVAYDLLFFDITDGLKLERIKKVSVRYENTISPSVYIAEFDNIKTQVGWLPKSYSISGEVRAPQGVLKGSGYWKIVGDYSFHSPPKSLPSINMPRFTRKQNFPGYDTGYVSEVPVDPNKKDPAIVVQEMQSLIQKENLGRAPAQIPLGLIPLGKSMWWYSTLWWVSTIVAATVGFLLLIGWVRKA